MSKISFLAGDTKFADHHQYGNLPFVDRPGGLFTSLYPVGFTLAEMMLLCWRVKKWKVTGTASWSNVDDDDSIAYDPSVQDPLPYLDYDSEENYGRKKRSTVVIADDRLLPFSYGPEALYIAFGRTGTGTGPFSWRLIASLNSFISGGGNADLANPVVYYDPDTQLFYPLIRFLLAMAHFSNIPASGYGMSSFKAETVGARPVVGTCSILGKSFDLYSLQDYAPVTTVAATFVWEPDEYWPFSNSLGDPVYDTVTGVQINSPFL